MSADTLSGIPGTGFIYETKKKKTKLEESFQGARSRQRGAGNCQSFCLVLIVAIAPARWLLPR